LIGFQQLSLFSFLIFSEKKQLFFLGIEKKRNIASENSPLIGREIERRHITQ